jgi:hypothetical protein
VGHGSPDCANRERKLLPRLQGPWSCDFHEGFVPDPVGLRSMHAFMCALVHTGHNEQKLHVLTYGPSECAHVSNYRSICCTAKLRRLRGSSCICVCMRTNMQSRPARAVHAILMPSLPWTSPGRTRSGPATISLFFGCCASALRSATRSPELPQCPYK